MITEFFYDDKQQEHFLDFEYTMRVDKTKEYQHVFVNNINANPCCIFFLGRYKIQNLYLAEIKESFKECVASMFNLKSRVYSLDIEYLRYIEKINFKGDKNLTPKEKFQTWLTLESKKTDEEVWNDINERYGGIISFG